MSDCEQYVLILPGLGSTLDPGSKMYSFMAMPMKIGLNVYLLTMSEPHYLYAFHKNIGRQIALENAECHDHFNYVKYAEIFISGRDHSIYEMRDF